jgi:serine/threonine-protein kinase RsbW
MDSEKKIQLKINSCYDHISLIAQGIMTMVGRYVKTEKLQGSIELCLVEVANNVVEHSYHGQEGHLITFDITLSNKQVTFLVIDNGDSLPVENMNKIIDWDDLDKDDINSWETNGRGLQIVRELMDDVSYRTESGFNYFKMVKRIP